MQAKKMVRETQCDKPHRVKYMTFDRRSGWVLHMFGMSQKPEIRQHNTNSPARELQGNEYVFRRGTGPLQLKGLHTTDSVLAIFDARPCASNNSDASHSATAAHSQLCDA